MVKSNLNKTYYEKKLSVLEKYKGSEKYFSCIAVPMFNLSAYYIAVTLNNFEHLLPTCIVGTVISAVMPYAVLRSLIYSTNKTLNEINNSASQQELEMLNR